MTKCTYCGRTDRACQTDAQVIGCDPMPVYVGVDWAKPGSDKTVYYVPKQTPRQRLAWAIQEAEKHPNPWATILTLEDARAILAALKDADIA